MRTATATAAAAALLLGSVSAGSSDSNNLVLDTTFSQSSDVSSDADQTWSAWTSSTTTSTTSADPSTWSQWDTTSSSSTSSSSTSTDPQTWSEWDSTTSSIPSTSTSTSTTSNSSDPSQTWAQWTSSISSSSVSSKTPDASQTWSAWDPTETVTSISTQWTTVTVLPVNNAQSWSAWASDSATTSSTKTKTTVTNTAVVSSTVTKTATGVLGTTSSASFSLPSTDGQNWSGWSSIAAPVAVVDPLCKIEISISYGEPVWFPTPVIATSVNSTAWGNWDGASSTPVASTSTSTGPALVWSDWASATTSTPVIKTSTSTDPGQNWSAWSSASSSTPAVQTSTSTDGQNWSQWAPATSSTPAISTDPAVSWGVWQSSTSSTPASKVSTDGASWGSWGVVSQTQGGAFYTASAGSSSGSSSSSNSNSNSGSWTTSSNGISANGNKFGMTYSPYTASGDCKDQGTVSADIAALAAKGFTSVRVYSTDCSTLEFVGSAAKQNGIKVILGVFISDTGISGAQPQVDAIAQWAQWDLVELIVVGNEAVFSNRCSASDLAGFIASSKATFQAAGFKGAISTTDELSVWQSQGSAWCDVIDVVSANLYAFFNPNTPAEDAGNFIQQQIQDLSTVCPGKAVYVMESGWPSAGECNGLACPSPENQAVAIKGIQQTSGAKVVFFSFEDEQWKQPGQYGVEQHWGCGSLFD